MVSEELDKETVRQIFDLRDMGHSIYSIADMLNIHYQTVRKYLKRYSSFEEYLRDKLEKEIKRTMKKSMTTQDTAIKREIEAKLLDITAQELAKLYSYAYAVKRYESIAHELNMTTEQLIKEAVEFYTQSYARFKELEEENKVLRDAVKLLIEILDEESFNKRLQLYAIEKAVEKMEKDDIMRLFKTLWGGVDGRR